MRRHPYFLPLSAAIVSVLAAAQPATAQLQLFDRSCNALQLVNQQARLEQLPQEDREYYEGTTVGFEQQVKTLFEESAALEEQYKDVVLQNLTIVLNSRTDLAVLADDYHDEILQEHPDLEWLLQQDDPQARDFYNLQLLSRLQQLAEFNDVLGERLASDPEHDRVLAAALRKQTNEYHELERQQHEARLRMTSQDNYNQWVADTAESFLNQQGFSSTNTSIVLDTPAYQQLVGTLAAVGAAAGSPLNESGHEAAAAEVQRCFVVEGCFGATDAVAGSENVVEATQMMKTTVQHLDSQLLEVSLDLQHLQYLLGEPRERAKSMTDTGRQLSAETAKTTFSAVQNYNKVQKSYDRIAQIEVLALPSQTEPTSGVKQWVNDFAESTKEAVGQIIVKYLY